MELQGEPYQNLIRIDPILALKGSPPLNQGFAETTSRHRQATDDMSINKHQQQ